MASANSADQKYTEHAFPHLTCSLVFRSLSRAGVVVLGARFPPINVGWPRETSLSQRPSIIPAPRLKPGCATRNGCAGCPEDQSVAGLSDLAWPGPPGLGLGRDCFQRPPDRAADSERRGTIAAPCRRRPGPEPIDHGAGSRTPSVKLRYPASGYSDTGIVQGSGRLGSVSGRQPGARN
jgi:hypothetical protein